MTEEYESFFDKRKKQAEKNGFDTIISLNEAIDEYCFCHYTNITFSGEEVWVTGPCKILSVNYLTEVEKVILTRPYRIIKL